jgi:hypothetical protein
MSLIHQDLIECIKSKKANIHVFKSCDQLDIPFVIQNRVIYAASQNTTFDDLKIGG